MFSTDETIASKHEFKRILYHVYANVRSYRAYNDRFHDQSFSDDVSKNLQTIYFSGVGAHHQNSVAKLCIRRVFEIARNLLFHAKRHWPEVMDPIFWTMPPKEVVRAHSNFHFDKDGHNLISELHNTTERPMAKNHTWGCPIYVSDNRLQTVSKILKWEPRAHLGVYML